MSKLPPGAFDLFSGKRHKPATEVVHQQSLLITAIAGSVTGYVVKNTKRSRIDARIDLKVDRSVIPHSEMQISPTLPTPSPRTVKDQPSRPQQNKLHPLAVRLFKRNFNGPKNSTEFQYCSAVPPKPVSTCGDQSCFRGCREQSSDDVNVDDECSDDNNSDIDLTDDKLASSEEDEIDAFEDFVVPKSSSSAAKNISTPVKKETRQRHDAESLKKYAYG